MMYRLIILTGPDTGQRVTIESKPMVIGRDPDCAIRVADEEVARKHAVIEHKPDGVFIRDLGSMNRILVNHHEVREQRLKHGDTIELGLTRFLVQAIVQADVTDEARTIKRARKTILNSVAAAFLILLGVLASIWILIQREEKTAENESAEILPQEPIETQTLTHLSEPTPPPPAAPIPPLVTAIVETGKQETADLRESLQPVSDELRLVREDIANLRETMKSLTVQPTPPPSAPVTNSLTPESAEVIATPVTGLRVVKLASVEHKKLPANDEFDERRMLNIGLAPEVLPAEIDPSAVHVEVAFFDEDPSNHIHQTHVITPKEPLTLDGPWEEKEQKIVTATYMVPAGFRNTEAGGPGKYYGYRVRIFYHDELQDADARPKTLLDYMTNSASIDETHPPETPAPGAGST